MAETLPSVPQMDREIIALANKALESAALIADAEADKLDLQRSRFSVTGASLNAAEMGAGARAARRIAMDIRKLKIGDRL